jgi:hypothetical protein
VSIPAAPERASRPAVERLAARAPQLLALAEAVVARLPATSRLRRRALQEGFSRGFAAINRGDPWSIPTAYEPDSEIYPAAGFRALGLADCYRGHRGWHELIEAIRAELPDVRWTPEHLIDLGDRWVLRLDMSGSGRASGVPTHQTWGTVIQISPRGRVTRQDIYWTWEETLAAAGLREDR